MQVFLPGGGLIPQGVGGQTVVPLPATGIAPLCLPDSALHAFAVALQGVVVAGFSTTVSSISPYFPMGKVATLSLLNLCFACKAAVDGDLSPILESSARGKGGMVGLSTLNH